jgi:hypothetical protein
VAGPAVLWFAWDKERFRDSGALLVSLWYVGGAPDLTTWFGDWRPVILILDGAMQDLLKQSDPQRHDLRPYLNCPVDFLGSVDTRNAYGRWDVYRVHWNALIPTTAH